MREIFRARSETGSQVRIKFPAGTTSPTADDNVMLYELPDYGTIDKLEDDNASGPSATVPAVDVRTPSLDVLRERMGAT